MPFTNFTNLDFEQIRTSIKEYLRANSNFTDFDFEGSNFSVLIDILAYNTYITAVNSNMIVNESFLDSATLRANVVSLARNIGYVPRSKTAAKASVTFQVSVDTSSPHLTLQAGLVCVGSASNTSYVFSIPEDITVPVIGGVATFGSTTSPITVYQGTYLKYTWTVDTSITQRFIIDNPSVDTSTLVVHVKGVNDSGIGREYYRVDNILNIHPGSEIYLIQEIQDEKYELLFGDGIFGKPLENNTVITTGYIVSDGINGNGAASFAFQGKFVDDLGVTVIPTGRVSINTISPAANGAEIEGLSSIKYFAPRLYSAQYRAVTSKDYEAIIQQIYRNTESVSVIGGEDLNPPQFGKVLISIKPKNGNYISDFDKQNILNNLKQYSITGIKQEIIDLKVLYVEIISSVYYNSAQVSNVNDLQTSVVNGLISYSKSTDVNKFAGRFRYSKVLQVIDRIDNAITSNITKVRIRRDLKVLLNRYAQYELCFGNRFHINPSGFNIKSTGFYIDGVVDSTGNLIKVYLTDVPNKDAAGMLDGSNMGVLSAISVSTQGTYKVQVKAVGTVDYSKGEIKLSTLNITGTDVPNNIIEIQAYPESNDVVGLRDLYLSFDVSKSSINMVKDVIASGEDISGVSFTRDYYTSSYANGSVERG
jgi:hypothetical protein